MIQKMGWWLYYPNLGLGLDYPGLFTNDYMVRFFFIDKERERIFIIKEMTPEEKQKTKKLYKFIKFNVYKKNEIIDLKNIKMNIDNFNSNTQLWKLVIENEACDENYQRHFRLNKILK
jgi:hypothetical protein